MDALQAASRLWSGEPCRSSWSTDDGRRVLGHIDFDGIGGVDADVALERARVLFPAAPVPKTSAGRWRMYFWSAREIPDAVLPELGAEIAANPGRLSIMHGVHPSGSDYEWVEPPAHDLSLIDVDALGLVVEPKAHQPYTGQRPGRELANASPQQAREFETLMARVGVVRVSDNERIAARGMRRLRRRSTSHGLRPSSTASGVGSRAGYADYESESPRYPRLVTLLLISERGSEKGYFSGVAASVRNGIASRCDQSTRGSRACRARASVSRRDLGRRGRRCHRVRLFGGRFRSGEDDHPLLRRPPVPVMHALAARGGCSCTLEAVRAANHTTASNRTQRRARRLVIPQAHSRTVPGVPRQRGLQGGVYAATVKREGDCWRAELLSPYRTSRLRNARTGAPLPPKCSVPVSAATKSSAPGNRRT